MDNDADNTLLQPCISRRGVPDDLEICGERRERCRIDGRRDLGSIMGGDFAFDLRHACECFVPAPFQFASHQPVGRVGSVVLPEGTIGCIARRFQIARECFAHLIPPLVGLFLGGHGRRNSAGAHHGEKRFLNGVIDPQTAKGNATRLAIVHPAAAAAVARDVMLRARVAKRQLAPASAATKQASQQSVAVLGRTVMTAGGDVAAHHLADCLGFLPADIAFVRVRHQRQPITARLAANFHANASSIIARRELKYSSVSSTLRKNERKSF